MHARWYGAVVARNDCIVSLDDDIYAHPNHFHLLKTEWESRPGLIHGYWGRNPKNGEYAEYVPFRDEDVEIVCTKMMVYHKKYAILMLDHLSRHGNKITHDMKDNRHEDIYMSYLAMHHSGQRNKIHSNPKGVDRPQDMGKEDGMSADEGHYEERNIVMKRCRETFWVPEYVK
jgi:hypothetical protein